MGHDAIAEIVMGVTIPDGDMEAAGTTDWTQATTDDGYPLWIVNAGITKFAGARTGGSGSRVLVLQAGAEMIE